ncbi:hypothetical protein F0919_08510 [Taibaiella lutea]|uniref:Poly-beta-1,6-N-acetyl-D-glucosamine biosynthesis protein PgaD n=1 Tax=Taibaiella lutea TaxID=2608001 RepID=A0A5M6CHV9_9BACT|nr:hypothetical protein [Taibaiella lutea]KAA5534647.1 hypothetical protein F0919_08510 [Taibaiella lutea]
MVSNNLKEDLIRDFLDQKKSINEQLLLIDPMAASLRKPAAKRLFHNGVIILLEIIAWLLFLGCIALIFLMDRITPFHILNRLIHDSSLREHYSFADFDLLHWAIIALVALAGILFFVITRMLASIRMKNTVLNIAGRNMKSLAEQMLHRKAVINSFEQRYELELPSDTDSIVIQNPKPHNDILL